MFGIICLKIFNNIGFWFFGYRGIGMCDVLINSRHVPENVVNSHLFSYIFRYNAQVIHYHYFNEKNSLKINL